MSKRIRARSKRMTFKAYKHPLIGVWDKPNVRVYYTWGSYYVFSESRLRYYWQDLAKGVSISE